MNEEKERVRRFFAGHAEAYRLSPSHRAGQDLEVLLRHLDPRPHERALDVATAAGHTALALAPHVAEVLGVDLTPEMEAAFLREAAERGVGNARFVVGDAERLPFPDASFDVVTCRRAAHHFPDVPRALAEMARVLRPGGRLGVVDMIAPDDPAGAELLNRLERLRDASHQRALGAAEWHRRVTEAGLSVLHAEVAAEDLPFTRWLYPVGPDSPEGRAAAAAAEEAWAAGPGAAEAVLSRGADGALVFRKRRIVLVAARG